MINLNIHYASAKNFLCFGEEGIELNFKNYGKVVLVKGYNYDDVDEEGNPSSNGSGKSAIADVIAYALYGKTVKKPKKLRHAIRLDFTHPLNCAPRNCLLLIVRRLKYGIRF